MWHILIRAAPYCGSLKMIVIHGGIVDHAQHFQISYLRKQLLSYLFQSTNCRFFFKWYGEYNMVLSSSILHNLFCFGILIHEIYIVLDAHGWNWTLARTKRKRNYRFDSSVGVHASADVQRQMEERIQEEKVIWCSLLMTLLNGQTQKKIPLRRGNLQLAILVYKNGVTHPLTQWHHFTSQI